MDRFISMGEKLGMSGKELKNWVTDEMNKERDERAAQRENERIKAEAEIAQANKDVEIVKAEIEKAKVEKEKTQVEKDAEIEKAKVEKEKAQVEKDAEMERAKVEKDAELEKAKLKKETEIEQQKLEQEFRLQQQKQQLEHEKAQTENKDTIKQNVSRIPEIPSLPVFMDGKDDIHSYLERFERYAKAHKWDADNWATMLSALLSGTALDVYARLSSDDAVKYEVVKTALLKRYNLTEEGFRSKFRNSRPEEGENARQFVTRVTTYLNQWMKMAEVTTLETLKDLIIREQFAYSCPRDLDIYLKEKEFISMDDMCEQSERFLEAHSKTLRNNNTRNEVHGTSHSKLKTHKDTERDKESMTEPRQVRECFNCHKTGHIKAECRNQYGGNEQYCTHCKLYGHVAEVCRNSKVIAGTMQVHHDKQGKKLNTGLKTTRGMVGNQGADVLRDSGCNSVCVDRKFVSDNQLTGEYKVCKLMDGSELKLPTAIIDIDTPYLKRHNVTAVCMERPSFELVIGDVEGAACKCNPNRQWQPKDMPGTIK